MFKLWISRIIIEFLNFKHQASQLFENYIKENNNFEYEVICGVPYGACGLATVRCSNLNKEI